MIPALILFRRTSWWLLIILATACSLLSTGFVRVAEWALREARTTCGQAVDVEEKGKNKNTKGEMVNRNLLTASDIGRIKNTHRSRPTPDFMKGDS